MAPLRAGDSAGTREAPLNLGPTDGPVGFGRDKFQPIPTCHGHRYPSMNALHPRLNSVASLGCLLLALTAPAGAAIIQPDTAVASSQFSATYAATHTIDGSGLAGAVSTLPTHAAYTSASGGNHWTTANGPSPLDAYITWGFNSAQTLDTIYLWNHQSTTSLAANDGYDVGNFALTFYNSANAVIGNYSGTLAFDSNAAQAFNFGAIAGVSSVRFDVNSIQNSQSAYTGLAEVAFNTTTITSRTPDTASTSGLLGLTVLALALYSRRLSPA